MNLKTYTAELCVALDAMFLSCAQPYATTIFQEFSVGIPTVHSVCTRPPPPQVWIYNCLKNPQGERHIPTEEHLKTITHAKIGIVNASTILYCKQRKSYLLSMWLCFSQKNETRWLFSQINRVSRWVGGRVGAQVDAGLVANWTGSQLGRGGEGGYTCDISYHMTYTGAYQWLLPTTIFIVYLGGKTPLHPQVRFQRKWQENANLLTCKFSNKLF